MWWFKGSASLFKFGLAGSLTALGRLAGLLLIYFVLLQFLLISRAAWLEKVYGLDKLARLHHKLGYWISLLIIIHPVFLVFGYSLTSKTTPWKQFLFFLTNYPDLFQAFVAVVLLLSVIGLSIYIVRSRFKYEAWYFVHLLVYMAVILAWGHQLKVGEDLIGNLWFSRFWVGLYMFVFGNLLVYRFFLPLWQSLRREIRVVKVVRETPTVTSVYLEGKDLAGLKVKAGQFFIWRFLDSQRWFSPHPFSLSCLPNGEYLRLTARVVGDFTNELGKIKVGTRVILEGPYGSFTADKVVKNKILFIAGGVGITPIRSLIEELGKSKEMVLIYGNRSKEEIIFKRELDSLKKRFNLKIDYLTGGVIGKVMIKAWAKNLKGWEVYLCGPPKMMESIIKQLTEWGLPKEQLHYEKFSL